MPAVLVTGAGRGIGSAIAAHLASRGWDVIAGVRNERDVPRLTAAGFTPVILDVTNADHIAALNDSLPDRLDAVVNNAGVVVGGPMEVVAPEDLRRASGIHFQPQWQGVVPYVRSLLWVEVRAGGSRGCTADGTPTVGHRRRDCRTRTDRYRHVAHRGYIRRRNRGRNATADAGAIPTTPSGIEKIDSEVAEVGCAS